MGRQKQYPLSKKLENNLEKLLEALNKFRKIYNKPMIVSSGYRPVAINKNISGAAKKSSHIVCMGCDFYDKDSELDLFCINNEDILEDCELYLEHPKWTKGWCHLQIRPTSRRIFIPYSSEPSISKFDILFKDLK